MSEKIPNRTNTDLDVLDIYVEKLYEIIKNNNDGVGVIRSAHKDDKIQEPSKSEFNPGNSIFLTDDSQMIVVEYYNSIEDITKNIRDPSKIFVQTQCMDAITRKTLRRVAYNRYDDWCKSRESRWNQSFFKTDILIILWGM